MPDKASKNPKPSLFSRFKNRVSSVVSPPLASPRPHSPLPSDEDTPNPDADTQLPPPSPSHRPSVSSFAAHSTENSVPASPPPSPQRPAHHLEVSVWQNPSPTHLAPPPTLQYPQGQTPTYQGPARSQGTFSGAHGFVMNYPVLNDYSTTTVTDNFKEKLLQHTIIGAEFDSSARDPPPRCHPGTRLAIIQRCLDFIEQCQDEGKLRWICGPAGVGKSAVMQMVTEKVPGGVIFASVFFSINGRADGSKAILTIAYQLAVKCEPYHQLIQYQINHDPSLLHKSLSAQFNKFIVEPFMLNCLFEHSRRFLVVIDGLDECDKSSTQEEILGLITDSCITYPTSPIAWIVASRPETHITAFFDQDKVKQAYIKEEIEVDSDEAREEVERYLRDELKKIQLKHPTLKHKREWPSELEFTKIASSAGGLFTYAAAVVRYIDDPKCRNPPAQLRRVLETIDGGTKDHMAGNDHPMAHLDALYKRILSDIPANTMINARKLLAVCSTWVPSIEFRRSCNMLGLTEDDAYGAICHLQAIMKTPEPDKADNEPLSFYHKSFKDFLFDSTRSGFSDDFRDEGRRLGVQASLRIIGEVPYGSDSRASGEDITVRYFGYVKGFCDNVTLSWPGDERFQKDDHQLQIDLYSEIMFRICLDFKSDDSPFGNISWFHALTTRFTKLGFDFPIYPVRDSAFGQFRRELMELGKLKQVPLWALDYAAICGEIDLRFTSPIESDVELSDSWSPSCNHKQEEIDGLQQRRGWSTEFQRYYEVDSPTEDEEEMDIPRFHVVTLQEPHQVRFQFYVRDGCDHCSRRFARHFMNNQDQVATVFVDGTQMSYVEFSFVDPDDGVSEWRYRFYHSGRPASIDV